MRTKHRLFTMGGLLAGAVALGCQAPAVAPQGLGAPRAVVHAGAVKLEPDADMAIVLNRSDCGEKPFALKQVGPDPRVAYIRVEVTGPGLVEPYKKTITRDAFGGLCDATLNLAGLATGTYDVRFTSYNVTDDPVAFARSPVDVTNGATSQLNLVCNFDLGKLDVNIHCCDGSPTPVPSGSVTPVPSPTPTATPTPAPTPTPTPPPVDPSSLINVVRGLDVDVDGNLYLIGPDPTAVSTDPNRGMIARVPGLRGQPAEAFDRELQAPAHDIEIVGDIVAVPLHLEAGVGNQIRFLDRHSGAEVLGRTPVTLGNVYTLAQDPAAASMPDVRAAIYGFYVSGGGGTRIASVLTNPRANPTDALMIQTRTVSAAGYVPFSMLFEGPRTPLWTSGTGGGGLTQIGADGPVAVPGQAASPAPTTALGLEAFAEGGHLVTFKGDRNIYRWDRSAPGTLAPLTPNPLPDGGYPRFIQRIPDAAGTTYAVLTFESAGPETNTNFVQVGGSTRYKVMRFRAEAGSLTYLDTPVATYPLAATER